MQTRTTRRGFTLIELLVTIGIIGILVGLTVAVGHHVRQGSYRSLTQDTIRVLDNALSAYVTAKEENPPAWEYLSNLDGTAGNASVGRQRFPAADARDWSTGKMINGIGVFYYQASQVPAAKAVLDTLPSSLVWAEDVDQGGIQPSMVTVHDAWKNPIRYVHPLFQGVITDDIASANPQAARPRRIQQVLGTLPTTTPPETYALREVRRNTDSGNNWDPKTSPWQDWPDSDGGATGDRPYFYSAGADGIAGMLHYPGGRNVDSNADNVYTTLPKGVKN